MWLIVSKMKANQPQMNPFSPPEKKYTNKKHPDLVTSRDQETSKLWGLEQVSGQVFRTSWLGWYWECKIHRLSPLTLDKMVSWFVFCSCDHTLTKINLGLKGVDFSLLVPKLQSGMVCMRISAPCPPDSKHLDTWSHCSQRLRRCDLAVGSLILRGGCARS